MPDLNKIIDDLSKLISILLAHSEKMSSLSAENSETQPKE